MRKKIMVLNGPNLDMLEYRNPDIYGKISLKVINKELKKNKKFTFKFVNSNSEGKMIDYIHKCFLKKYEALMINPGGYCHTSIALRDALEILNCPVIEIHLSDITKREDFRKIDFLEAVRTKVFMGNKEKSYYEALAYLDTLLNGEGHE